MNDILENPMLFERGRTKMFLEAKYLVDEQFPSATDEAKMGLIGSLVTAHSILLAGQMVGEELGGVAVAVENAGGK